MGATLTFLVVALFHYGPQPGHRPAWWYTVTCNRQQCITTVVVNTRRHNHEQH